MWFHSGHRAGLDSGVEQVEGWIEVLLSECSFGRKGQGKEGCFKYIFSKILNS